MASQIVINGSNALLELKEIFLQHKIQRIFLIRGKHSYEKSGAKRTLESLFSELKIQTNEFFEFENNPKEGDVNRCLQALKDVDVQAVMAVGGGSSIDMAKLTRYQYSDIKRLPLYAVPTTAGSGAESTPFAVCYKNNVKYSIDNPNIIPDVAVLYAPFTYCNSSYLTACSGFDALAQAIEAYWNVNATDESDRYAEEAIRNLWRNLPLCVNSPSPQIREAVLYGANLAGKAIAITRTTAPHAFSYAFTTYCGYPHGHAVALTFPFFMDLNVKSNHSKKMEYLCEMINLHRDSIKNDLTSYLDKLGLSNNLNLNEEKVLYFLNKVNLERLSNNPVKIGKAEIGSLANFLYKKRKLYEA